MYSVTDCREELDATPTTSSASRYNGLALKSQLRSERIQCGGCVLSIRALGLEPCEQKLQAQRVAVMVPALAAAVGCVLLWARAPPFLEAVFVDPLGGAAAGARLHERAVVFFSEAQLARHLLHDHLSFGRRAVALCKCDCAVLFAGRARERRERCLCVKRRERAARKASLPRGNNKHTTIFLVRGLTS